MKAQDLRIGNWIYDCFKPANPIKCMVDLDLFQAINNYRRCNAVYPMMPIKLTEEWLRKFGFTVPWVACWQNGSGLIIRESIEGKFDVRLSDYLGYITLDYVHQLQNFYYEIKREELTLKE